jgi:phosphatidylserine/phosphatidylglycerophosphate/cardiolipin synthase-like enzyme
MEQGYAEPELVITAPAGITPVLAQRTKSRITLGVLARLVAEAQHEVILGSPYAAAKMLSDGPLAHSLQTALRRGVDVHWMSTPIAIKALNLKLDGPGRLTSYQPNEGLLEDPTAIGSHAKFLVADATHAYVGSANFTGRGLGDQLEMGVLVHGPAARQVAVFWHYVVQTGLFVRAGETG